MIERKVKNFILQNNLIKQHDKIIAGLSGGPDSVCLLNILNNLKHDLQISLIAAHLDHEWRPNSGEDVLFCQSFAEKLGVQFFSKKASEFVAELKLEVPSYGNARCNLDAKTEETGRLLRRQYFEGLALHHNANSIALGHHWNDQEETFFIRLIRGSTISGLSAIKAKKDGYIRPLLNLTKLEIVDYLEKNNIGYIQDYTNNLDTFLRNRIRKYLIPEIKKIDPRFDITFKKTLSHIQQADSFISRAVDQAFQDILVDVQVDQLFQTIQINRSKFLALDKFLHVPILIKWFCLENIKFCPTEKIFSEILRFINLPGTAIHKIYSGWSIEKKKNILKITKLKN